MDANERRSRVVAEAAEWLACLQSDECSREDRERYVEWLRESPVHVAEMLRTAQLSESLRRWHRKPHRSVEALSATVVMLPARNRRATLSEGISGDDGRSRKPRSETPRSESAHRAASRTRAPRIALLSAAAAAVLAVLAFFWLMPGDQIIRTDRGERREVLLAEGSVVQVDPGSSLRISLTEQTRRVRLERGRAMFRVAHDSARPFLVEADGVVVRAVGTAFGVERQRQGVMITVAEGKVAVLSSRHPATNEPAGAAAAQPRSQVARERANEMPAPGAGAIATYMPDDGAVMLVANQQVTMTAGEANPVRAVDSRKVLAWAEGRLIFDHEPVTAVIEAFNRYNRLQLHVTDASLARRPVSGTFRASDPESFVAFIQSVSRVRVVRSGELDLTFAEIGDAGR
ncbi:MAG: FecR domain-containing protein [Gammaproteobacteria bacterium]